MRVTCSYCGTTNPVSISGRSKARIECGRPVRTRLGWVLAGLLLTAALMLPPVWVTPQVRWTGRSEQLVPVRIIDAATREPVPSAEVELENENYWADSRTRALTEEGVARPVARFHSHGSRSRRRDVTWIVLSGWKLNVSADGFWPTSVCLPDRLGDAWNDKNPIPLLTIEIQKRDPGEGN